MKSILYAGAALMIGASIYGFVDYKKTSHKKEFNSMYEEEKKKPAVTVPVNNSTTGSAKEEVINNKETKASKKENVTAKKKSKKIDAELFSRAPLRDEVKEVTPPRKTEPKKTENKEQ
ncbi:MAG: hypothetical protein JNK27_07145 [Chitinophagaceae bacterium]|nr:hypothetical protein [Chitinophagaceae bacterium]